RLLNGRQWLCEQYSVLDPYALLFYTWGVRRELPVADLQHYRAFKDRMLARPAVARVLADEKVKV
ncbi:MAG TPA: glutathione S-transferase, partial [Hyphomicrobiaceae bacterium]|nr:glutathione S-transferase [Hyphomicrobiaceae bacterium]